MPTPIVPCLVSPHPEAGVARVEVVLLGVAGPVGDVALAVGAEHRAVGVDDHHRVERRLPGPLVDAQRQHDLELGGESWRSARPSGGRRSAGPGEVLGQLVDAEVRALEQLGDQDDLGALAGGVARPAARRWRRCRRGRRSSPSAPRRHEARPWQDATSVGHWSVRASVERHAASRRSRRSVARPRSNAATATTRTSSRARVPTWLSNGPGESALTRKGGRPSTRVATARCR